MKNFVVYKAGAGSGKTFTLVKEYLRLALHDREKLQQNYRQILAITFTNKAAAEMKTRVVQALDRIASGKEADTMSEQLCGELQISFPELKERALAVLTHLLHHYSDFSIGTIDSFTHKIVRTFAQELDLPVNFNVELDAAAFYEKVISQLLSLVGEDQEISALLREFVLTRTEDNSNWDPEQGIREFTTLLMQENAKAYLEKLAALSPAELEELRKELRDFSAAYQRQLRSAAASAIAVIDQHGLTDDDFIYKKSGPQSFFYKCFRGSAELADAHGKRITDAIENGKWFSGGDRAGIGEALSRAGRELQQHMEDNHRRYTLCSILSKQMYVLMLLRKIDEISREQKEEDRIVFISEFNTRIYDLINSEPAPFIYERLGERFRHFLLDEFQDTSSLQWLNLLPLLDNSLGGGWYNLIVGDGKQSIYRWRNANVNQFAILPALEHDGNPVQLEREASLKRNFDSRTLGVNYRSSKTLVEFNNELFEELGRMAEGEHVKIYKEHQQQSNSQEEGYITINTGECDASELDEININLTVQYITDALNDGYKYRDICILCRRNLHGNVIAGSLVQHGIPVVSSDSLLLRNNPEVNTLISYLRAVLNPRDHVSSAAVLAYLLARGTISAEQFDELLKQISVGAALQKILKEVTKQELAEASAGLTEQCVQFAAALGMEQHAGQYIRFLLDEVNEFMVTHSPGIGAFLEWWENRSKKASLILPADTDAVRIMTIHSSKGLEFPVVILPYCNWPVFRQGDSWVNVRQEGIRLPVSVIRLSRKAAESGFSEEFEKEQRDQVLDNVNLLYVALTRAAERMHIVCNRSKGNTGQMAGDWIVEFVENKFGACPDGMYTIGARHKRDVEENSAAGHIMSLRNLAFAEGRSAVKMKQSVSSAATTEALLHGILLHDLLSRIRTGSDVSPVLERSVLQGQLAAAQVPAYRDAINKIISHPSLVIYFHEDVKSMNEAGILTSEGALLRPDKVSFMEDHVAVIDYKTGAEKSRQHAEQLMQYERALLQMGHTTIKKLIVYAEEGRVVELN